MQGNGFKLMAVAAFFVLAIYYLFPTFQNYLNARELDAMDDTEREAYENDNYESLQSTRERALKLGLDLQGGMHVTLEVGMDALLAGLAEGRRDPVFNQALATARRQATTSRASFIELFTGAIEEAQPGTRLSRYFRDADDGITARSDNDEVIAYLNAEADDALNRAVEIIRKRINRFGVSETSIQKKGNSRISVEIPGVDDPQRVRDLLKGTARLEFHLMADPQELQTAAARVVQYYQNGGTLPGADTTAAATADTSAADADTAAVATADSVAADSAAASGDTALTDVTELFDETPAAAEGEGFTSIFRLFTDDRLPVFGQVALSDTAEVRRYLAVPAVQNMIPAGIELLYTASPTAEDASGQPVFFLLGVRERAELSGEVLTDARPTFDPITNEPKVSLTMNSEGAQRWSQITGANVGRNVAIVLDDVVYTYPNILERIPGGRTEIEGVTREEADDIVTVLKSGALPAPVNIIEERTVGPSLGAASIRAGALSFLVGFIVVALFTVMYYRWAGAIAVVAISTNVFLLFGILAAFGAVLTLPGIAGIVLTLGMAVDANVLIYERVREELAAGKTLKAATEAGFDKALSSILDGNITTFFVGVILYSFGVGPIQGFAVTLMAGIVTSLFTALVVTRLILNWLVAERRTAVDFG